MTKLILKAVASLRGKGACVTLFTERVTQFKIIFFRDTLFEIEQTDQYLATV